ncbi:D-alanyl-D-alanine carboxypeptidase family protein [Pseudogemmobacter bohemicus]|uniref:D-alanyl-D-alanine carboxypeptidase family protein n=1 Tax=Pseudogemmobacter bohemicus TaxID=2250708 RepID=UPI000DD45FFC|nr:D-alanyl-D-alanine carboxypeptidase family protein [Pseudogemmobacter bohemicus]
MASLIGRVIRTLTLFGALFALILPALAPAPAHAAPFAAIILDARTGEELWSQNADTKLHPASLTKMMTLYITFQEIQAGRMSLDTVVTVTKRAAAQPPSRLGLKAGQKIKVRYLIRAAAIKSANDAATALGDHIAGSEAAFASRMTRTARALGMKNTTFKNAHGLTAPGHLSTARDMTLLGRHLFYDFPQFYNIFSRRTADAGIAKVVNTNSRFLDGYEGADGIKTGYTVPAGFNLTASAKRGDKRIIATIFGGTSTAQRNAKMVELMNKGFSLARNGVREKRPAAVGIQGGDAAADLMAEAPTAIDTPDVPGGAGKTIRVSGAMTSSPRPKARPARVGAPSALIAEAAPVVVPDALSAAIAEGVESALAEATAVPPPPGTLEAQAVELAAAPVAAAPAELPMVDPESVEAALAAAAAPAAEAPAGTLEAQAAAMATATPAAAAPGSLEAQAAALAAGGAPAETPAPVETPAQDMALAGIRPMPRPDSLTRPATVAEAPPETLTAEVAPGAAPVYETVAPATEPVQLAEISDIAPDVMSELPAPTGYEGTLTAVETVVADAQTMVTEPEAPARRAPIFEPVRMASADTGTEAPVEDLVVVSKSTSGGRGFGVAVGAYNSEYEASRALLRTGLTESATLDQGLRKVTQKGGKYRASFLGLTEEQAELACRRLRARGTVCETMGPA